MVLTVARVATGSAAGWLRSAASGLADAPPARAANREFVAAAKAGAGGQGGKNGYFNSRKQLGQGYAFDDYEFSSDDENEDPAAAVAAPALATPLGRWRGPLEFWDAADEAAYIDWACSAWQVESWLIGMLHFCKHAKAPCFCCCYSGSAPCGQQLAACAKVKLAAASLAGAAGHRGRQRSAGPHHDADGVAQHRLHRVRVALHSACSPNYCDNDGHAGRSCRQFDRPRDATILINLAPAPFRCGLLVGGWLLGVCRVLLAALLLVGVHLILLRRPHYVRHREWLVSGEPTATLRHCILLPHSDWLHFCATIKLHSDATSSHCFLEMQVHGCCVPSSRPSAWRRRWR